MFRCHIFFYFYLIKTVNACIPTQQVETVSSSTYPSTVLSTTNATTTTTTEEPYPCNVCTKIYNANCQGYGIPSTSNWCVIASDVPVTYTLESAFDYAYGEDACKSVLTCPSGTISYLVSYGSEIFGDEYGTFPTTVYCAETGDYVGMWMYYTEGHGEPITDMYCKP